MFLDSPSVASDSSPSREQNLKNKFSPLIGGGGHKPEGVATKIYPITHNNALTNHIKISRSSKNKQQY